MKNKRGRPSKKVMDRKETIPASELPGIIPTKTTLPTPVSAPVNLDKVIEDQVSKKVKEFLKSQEKDKNKEALDYQPIEAMLTEFLKSFIIIGYNLNGDRVVLGYSKSRQDHDALVEHLRNIFIRMVSDI